MTDGPLARSAHGRSRASAILRRHRGWPTQRQASLQFAHKIPAVLGTALPPQNQETGLHGPISSTPPEEQTGPAAADTCASVISSAGSLSSVTPAWVAIDGSRTGQRPLPRLEPSRSARRERCIFIMFLSTAGATSRTAIQRAVEPAAGGGDWTEGVET